MSSLNTAYRIALPGTELDYYDARSAVNAIRSGAYEGLPYTSRVLAEQLLRRCEPNALTEALTQLVERRRDSDFPWYPASCLLYTSPSPRDRG